MGCAFLTKFNAVFLLPPLFLWAVWADRRRNLVTLIAIGGVGAGLFLLGWPFLWDHPLSKGIGYLTTKIQHDLVPAYYLGKTYSDVPAPWHYPFVTFWATTPSVQLACLFVGWMHCLSGRGDQARLLPWVVLAFLLPCALPSVGKYDGVRLFLTGIAFSAVMAGIGLSELARMLHRRWGGPLGTLPVCAFALGAAHCLSVYPHFLSYYSDLVGGVRGAQAMGFETTYWGESLTPRLFEKAHEEIGIHRLAVAPVGDNVRALSKNMGLLPKDMELVNPEGEPFDALALLCRQGMFSPEDWWLYRHARPLLKTEISGIPLVILVSEDEVRRAQAESAPLTKDDHR